MGCLTAAAAAVGAFLMMWAYGWIVHLTGG